MKLLEAARQQAEDRLAASRREAEERLSSVRVSMSQELGFAPRKAMLLLLIAAGATGFAFSLRRFRRRRLRDRRS